MLFSVSTIKDSVDNVAFFVEANLASGVDHMVVFLDAPDEPEQQQVAASLAATPHVTAVPTSSAWWQGSRPASLNVRQRINANWVRHALEPLDWAQWLVHVDGDEVARVDRDALAAVPADADAFWMPPWEAVSEWEAGASGRPHLFKRLLDGPDLSLLMVLGHLPEATNQAYFHGHVMGKSGVRPASGLGLTLHGVVTPQGAKVEPHEAPGFRVLHYDAPSGEEFVRKWTALAHAGPARYRPSRQPVARALRALVTRDLPDEVRERYLRQVYEATTRDDVQTLSELGLLETADPLSGGRRPQPLSATQSAELTARVEHLTPAPKGDYLVPDKPGEADGAGAAPSAGSEPGATAGPKERLKRLARRR